MGMLGDELSKVLLRHRKKHRFTQNELGERIDTSGSYISSLETGKASPRVADLEDMAACFRTTAFAMLQEADEAEESYVPTPTGTATTVSLDAIAAELSPARGEVAREFLLFLRERERVDRS